MPWYGLDADARTSGANAVRRDVFHVPPLGAWLNGLFSMNASGDFGRTAGCWLLYGEFGISAFQFGLC